MQQEEFQQQKEFQEQEKQQNEFQQQEEHSEGNFVREKDYLRASVERKLIYPDENMRIKRVKHSEHSIDYNNKVSIMFYYIVECIFIHISTKISFF